LISLHAKYAFYAQESIHWYIIISGVTDVRGDRGQMPPLAAQVSDVGPFLEIGPLNSASFAS